MPINFEQMRGGADPFDGYLKFSFKNGVIEEWAFTFDTSALSLDKIKTQLQIKQGSPARASLLGTGFIDIGRAISIDVPIFAKKNLTIQEQVLKLSSYIGNVNNYKCEMFIREGDTWWFAEVKPFSMGAVKFKDVWNTGGTSLSINMIDNYFKNDRTTSIDGLFVDKGIGEWKESITVDTYIDTQCTFEWNLTNPLLVAQEAILQCRFYKAGGYGIYLKTVVKTRDVALAYDGSLFYVNGGGVVPTGGLNPDLSNGLNEIYIRSNFDTIDFSLKYRELAVF